MTEMVAVDSSKSTSAYYSVKLPWCLCVWTFNKRSPLARLTFFVLLLVLVSTIIANIFFIFNLETSSKFYVFENSIKRGRNTVDTDSQKDVVGPIQTTMSSSEIIDVLAYSSMGHIFISVDGIKILEKSSNATRDRGIHVTVLNQATGAVMATKLFDTFSGDESNGLVYFVNMVSDGRILVFTLKDEGSLHLSKAARKVLEELGSKHSWEIKWRDSWAFIVAKKASGVYAEVHNHNKDIAAWGAPVLARAQIVLVSEEQARCPWDGSDVSDRRRQLCERFEGYGNVCRCNDPDPIDISRAQQPYKVFVADIPVAIVASNRPHYLFRGLRSMLLADGAKRELFTVFIDGFYEEPVAVATLLGVRVVQHVPISSANARISQHYKRTLKETFNMFPDAEYMIVLEEDLDVSVDIFSYFTQLLPLMDEDDSLYCISAWNDQGYDHTCKDPSMLYRVEGMPGLGWLLKRRLFEEELEQKWPPPNVLWDWDVWMRMPQNRKGRECIIPDVSRTYHFGSKGLNIYIIFQKHYFKNHAFNVQPNVRFDVELMEKDKYETEITRLMKQAILLDHHKNPCDEDFIPDTARKIYVVYIKMKHAKDWETWLNVARCLQIWDWDARGHHQGMWRLWLKGNHVLFVGAPASPYAKHKPRGIQPIFIRGKKLARIYEAVDKESQELQREIHKQN